MSIDQRLREAFRTDESDAVEPIDTAQLVEGWADVMARTDAARTRARNRRSLGLAAAAVLLAAAAVAWWPDSDHGIEPLGPSPIPSSSAPTAEKTPLDADWSTGQVRARRLVAHLESLGLGQWAEAVLEGTPENSRIELQLKLAGGHVSLTKTVDGQPLGVIDMERYEVTGAQVTFRPDAVSCSSVLGWQILGDRLRLEPVSTTCPDHQGISELAALHGLYGAFPFVRTDG